MKRKPLKVSLLGSSTWVGGLAALALGVSSVTFFVGLGHFSAANTAPHPIVEDMRDHLNEISSNISSYMQNRDPFAIERVKVEGKEVGHLVAKLSEQLTIQGQGDAIPYLEKAHQGMREASVSLLTADQEVVAARTALEQTARTLESSLSGRDALPRARATQARATLDQYMKHVASYKQADINKQQAADRFLMWRDRFEKAMLDIPAVPVSTTHQVIRTVLVALLMLIAPMGILAAFTRTHRQYVRPLKDILNCVEAASTGDMSRLPDYWSADAIGRLSQAVGRLITVLSRSENLVYHLAALVESSGDAIISHTLDGKILSWNKGAQRMYGFSAEEMKGRLIEALLNDEGKKEMMEKLKRLQEGERIKPFETVHQARNGRQVQTLVRMAAIFDSTRQIIGASFIAQELPQSRSSRPANISHSHQ